MTLRLVLCTMILTLGLLGFKFVLSSGYPRFDICEALFGVDIEIDELPVLR